MSDKIYKKDVDSVVESINNFSCIKDNGLKLRYYRSNGSYRVGLILNLETNSEQEFKHKLNHYGVQLSLINFKHLVWMFEENNVKVTREMVIHIMENCGFTYYQ